MNSLELFSEEYNLIATGTTEKREERLLLSWTMFRMNKMKVRDNFFTCKSYEVSFNEMC